MKTKINNTRLPGMKVTDIPLKIGGHKGGLDLWVRMKIDGQTVREFPGHSFVAQFAYDLHAHFHGGEAPRMVSLNSTASSGAAGPQVRDATNTTPIRITCSSFSNNYSQDDDYVWIQRVLGNTAANGLFIMKNRSGTSFDLYELDGITPVAGNGAYVSDGLANMVGLRDWSFNRVGSGTSHYSAPERVGYFGLWNLRVGTRQDAVTVNDFGLYDAQLNRGGTSVSVQTTNKPSSRFSLTKTFTNNTVNTIQIAEIGITRRTYNNDDNLETLIARDVLSAPLNLLPTKILTVEYEVIAELQPDTQDTDLDGTNGGFTEYFVNRLRVLATTNPIANTMNIYNVAAPAANASSNSASNVPGWKMGLRLGKDNTYVSTTDTKLIDEIPHDENGLYYHGSNVENVEIDEPNNKATFQINRIFENRSTSPITVKEVGLFGNGNNSTTFTKPDMFARTALAPADQFTIQPGEFRMVRYTLEFIA